MVPPTNDLLVRTLPRSSTQSTQYSADENDCPGPISKNSLLSSDYVPVKETKKNQTYSKFRRAYSYTY
jgi:hypothetical protein